MKRQNMSPTAIVGAALLVIGMLAIAPQAWACFCKCYFSSDCASGEYCDWNNCTHKTVNGKLKDGLCKKRGSVEPTQQEPAARALAIWMDAFAGAGANGGGEPDAKVLGKLTDIGLSDQLHADIREIALSIFGQTVGYTSFPDDMHTNPGFFSAPLFVVETDAEPCGVDAIPTQLDNGVVAPLDDTLLGVTALVRDAVSAELRRPGKGILEAAVARIPEEFPNFVTTGNCEFPRMQGERSPYTDGLSCLTAELQLIVHSILSTPPATDTDLEIRHIGLAP